MGAALAAALSEHLAGAIVHSSKASSVSPLYAYAGSHPKTAHMKVAVLDRQVSADQCVAPGGKLCRGQLAHLPSQCRRQRKFHSGCLLCRRPESLPSRLPL